MVRWRKKKPQPHRASTRERGSATGLANTDTGRCTADASLQTAGPGMQAAVMGLQTVGMNLQTPHTRLQPDDAPQQARPKTAAAELAEVLQLVSDCLRRNEMDQADRVLADAMTRFGNDRQVLDAYASLPFRQGKWQEACRRYKTAIAALPGVPHSYAQLGIALHYSGEPEEADGVLSEAVHRFPRDIEVARDFARLASMRGDHPLALQRWELVRERFPNYAEGYTLGTQPLIELGRLDEAETMLELCQEQFADNYHFLFQRALIATRRSDWNEAFSRWASLLARFPGVASGPVAVRSAVALWQREISDGSEAATSVRLPAIVAEATGQTAPEN